MRRFVCLFWGLAVGCNLFSTEARQVPSADVGVALDAASDTAGLDQADLPADVAFDMAEAPRPCESTSDCGGGEDCIRDGSVSPTDRFCEPIQCGCTPDGWCDQGSRCVKTAPCADIMDCSGGQVCGAQGFCLDTCIASDECGPGFDCTSSPGQSYRICQPASCRCNLPTDYCDGGECVHSQLDCAAGCPAPEYACDMADNLCECTGPGCRQECLTDTDCAAFEVCDTATSGCTVDRCRMDSDCGAGSVCGYVDLLSRVCVRPGPGAPGEACGDAGDCAHGFCDDSVCRQPCLGADECPAGQLCTGVSVSYPQCTDSSPCANCGDTQTCMPNLFAGYLCVDDCLDVNECANQDHYCVQLFGGIPLWQFSSCSASGVEPGCPNVTDIWDPFSRSCAAPCVKDSECAGDEICWQQACRRTCVADCDCEPHESCGDWGACAPAIRCDEACVPDAACSGNGKVCDLASTTCVAP